MVVIASACSARGDELDVASVQEVLDADVLAVVGHSGEVRYALFLGTVGGSGPADVVAFDARDPSSQCLLQWETEVPFEGRSAYFRDPCLGSVYASDGARLFGPSASDLKEVATSISDGRVRVLEGDLPPTPPDAMSHTPSVAVTLLMEARRAQITEIVFDLLSDDLLEHAIAGSSDARLFPRSRYCWFDYQLDVLESRDDAMSFVVRVYQHHLEGDIVGGVPTSWIEEIDVEKASDSWVVTGLRVQSTPRPETDVRHGPSLSACVALVGE